MLEEIEKKSHPFHAHNHKPLEDRLEQALEESMPLFAFSQYSLDTLEGKLNPNIQVISINLEAVPEVKTGCGYLNKVREDIETLQNKTADIRLTSSCWSCPKIKFHGNCQEIKFNRTTFAKQMSNTTIKGNLAGKQTRYAKIMNSGHVLYFVLTYYHRASQKRLENIMRSTRFSQK